MAVRLADYYSNHFKRVVVFLAAACFVVNAIITWILLVLGMTLSTILVSVIIPVSIALSIALYGVIRYALEPLDVISRAITHVSGQPSATIPPAINNPRYERTGLRQMLQTVYDRAQTADEGQPHITTELSSTLPCGIIGLNADQQIIYANSRAPAILNAQGVYMMKLQFPRDDSLSAWLEYADTQTVNAEKFWQRVADGTPDQPDRRLYDVLAYYEKAAPGGIETRIVTIDRTTTYNDDQEAVDFISVAAHELRGPITVIRGYLDVLVQELGPALHGDQKELVDRLDVSASRLSGYINNILNVAKYDRSHLKLHLQEDRLSNIYATIADDLQLRARTQHRILSVAIPIDLPTIAADRNSLTEVLANLVDNAIKYSQEGSQVSVTAAVDGNFIRCSVRDSGIGIPSSVIGSLFTKFYRSHRSRSSVAGTGLGLYISKAIVDSHGGQIGVSSKEGEGSVFSFTVPIYATVADKLAAGNNGNEGIIESSSGWIKNHSKIGSQ